MIQKPFDEITRADIDALIDNGDSEIKTLEYKRELPGNTSSGKKEFLADVSSFANASGGDVIYGIEAEVDKEGKTTGAPKKVLPLQGTTPDQAILRLEHMVLNGIRPRFNVRIKKIDGYGEDGTGFVILIRIPNSFASPHMVAFDKSSRFYSRNSAGRVQLDVDEIRNAFLATESQEERIRGFIQDRISKIIVGETPVTIPDEGRLVLHLIPMRTFLNNQRLNLSALDAVFSPIGGASNSSTFNLDGFLRVDCNLDSSLGYCQLFFNGGIEAVQANIIRGEGEQRLIASVSYENDVIKAVKSYLQGYRRIEVDTPIVASLALLDCQDAVLSVRSYLFRSGHRPRLRNVMIFPNVIIDDFDADLTMVLKPIFDSVWNAFGYPRSMNYDDNGMWKTPR